VSARCPTLLRNASFEQFLFQLPFYALFSASSYAAAQITEADYRERSRLVRFLQLAVARLLRDKLASIQGKISCQGLFLMDVKLCFM